MNESTPRILLIGGGHVGLYAARRLQQRLRRREARITLVDPQSHMTYQPLLAEAAAGNVEPRHIAVPLRRVLPDVEIVNAELVRLDHADRRATVRLPTGEHRALDYDQVVLAPGSVARTLPIPGLAEHGVGFRSIGEATYLRNRVLDRLAFAASTADERARQRALTFVVVGGGYAGVETLGELSDMTAATVGAFDGLTPDAVRWVLVEATGRILPEVHPRLGEYVLDLLRRRGIEVHLETRLLACRDGLVELDPGAAFEADTLVWTAGVRPHPVLAATDLPLDERGRLPTDGFLRVVGAAGAWAAGDCAAVPDLTRDEPGALCPPTAQHAVRQARRLADNLVATLRGRVGRTYRHRYAGSVAGLGRFQGAAQIYGVCLRGLPAWLLHRGYHLVQIPSRGRQARVLADWTIGAVFPRDIVALGELHDPRALFTRAAAGTGPGTRPAGTSSVGTHPAEPTRPAEALSRGQ